MEEKENEKKNRETDERIDHYKEKSMWRGSWITQGQQEDGDHSQYMLALLFVWLTPSFPSGRIYIVIINTCIFKEPVYRTENCLPLCHLSSLPRSSLT